MADKELTPETVAQLAAAMRLPIEAAKLEQVAAAFQELLSSLEPLQTWGLQEVEPAGVFRLPLPYTGKES